MALPGGTHRAGQLLLPHPTPCTPYTAPRTPQPAPCTPYPTPCALQPAPCTSYPTPCSPHPVPRTLHPAPCTPYPAPHNLHPILCTLYPARPTVGQGHPGPWCGQREGGTRGNVPLKTKGARGGGQLGRTGVPGHSPAQACSRRGSCAGAATEPVPGHGMGSPAQPPCRVSAVSPHLHHTGELPGTALPQLPGGWQDQGREKDGDWITLPALNYPNRGGQVPRHWGDCLIPPRPLVLDRRGGAARPSDASGSCGRAAMSRIWSGAAKTSCRGWSQSLWFSWGCVKPPAPLSPGRGCCPHPVAPLTPFRWLLRQKVQMLRGCLPSRSPLAP